MVDAPEYPDAYIENKNFVFNFNKVKKIKNILYSSVKITFIKN